MGAPINGLYAWGDDDFVFWTTTENKIYLYDKGEEKIISEYTGSHDTSEFNASVRISTDNSSVICTSEDGYVVFYDLITKKEVSKVHAHSKAVITMDLFNTGEYNEGTDIMITGSLDKTIWVWTQEDANSGL